MRARTARRDTAIRPTHGRRGFVIGLIVVCTVGFALTAYYAFNFAMPIVDTLTYLEMGRNLLKGRGFVTRFNVIQAWSGHLAHPAMAYYNPLYGLVLGIIWELVGHPGAVAVIATALPCCVNAALIALLVRRTMGSLTALLSAIGYLLLSTTWVSLTILTADHPAVTVVLLCLLVIRSDTHPGPRRWLCGGAILGLGYFFKVATAIALPGMLVAIILMEAGPLAQRVRAATRPALSLLAGFALVVLPYLLLCELLYGEFYPVYAMAGKDWMLATAYGGHYVPASPAVQPDPARIPGLEERATNIALNQWLMLRTVASDLGLLTVPLIVGLAAARDGTRRQAIFLVAVGASMALGYGAAVNWERMEAGWSARYALYTAPFWYPVGVYGLVWLVERGLAAIPGSALSRTFLQLRSPPRLARDVAVVVIWLVVSLPAISARSTSLRRAASVPEPRGVQLQRAVSQLAPLVAPNDLIAVDPSTYAACATAYLDRPIVSLPFRAMDTPTALREFMQVFQPAVVIPGTTRSSFKLLPGMGYQAMQIPQFTLVFLRRR